MSQAVAQRETMQAVVDQNEITPMGTCKAQQQGGSMYGLIPPNPAQAHGVRQGTELVVGYHAPSRTVLLSPTSAVEPGHWADYILDSVGNPGQNNG